MEKRVCIRCSIGFLPRRMDQVYCCRTCSKSGPKGGRKSGKRKTPRPAKENTDETRLQRVLSKKGIDKADYLVLVEGHSNCCEICGKPADEERYKKLCLDHCHETGRPRGLLCVKCNSGLGMFRDKTELLLSAVKYLTYK